MTEQRLLKDSLVWGALLWLIGYVLGIALFLAVPTVLIGWIILPIGAAITVWVLLSRIESDTLLHYLVLAIVWTAMAIALDYVLIVQALQPADGYYKLDVYLYYALTFLIPLAVGWWRATRSRPVAYGSVRT